GEAIECGRARFRAPQPAQRLACAREESGRQHSAKSAVRRAAHERLGGEVVVLKRRLANGVACTERRALDGTAREDASASSKSSFTKPRDRPFGNTSKTGDCTRSSAKRSLVAEECARGDAPELAKCRAGWSILLVVDETLTDGLASLASAEHIGSAQ